MEKELTLGQVLLSEIETYCAAIKKAPSSFCLDVANNGTLPARLREGGGCHANTLIKIRKFISDNPVDTKGASNG
jgi:hypothetical protein